MTKQEEFLDYLTDPTKVIVRKKRDEFLKAAETLNYREDKPTVYLEEHITYCIIYAKAMRWQSLATLDTLFNHIFDDYHQYTRSFGNVNAASHYIRRYYICTNYFDETAFPEES